MLQELFDLRIATLANGQPAPGDAHLVRIQDPSAEEVAARTAEDWFYKPAWVTYVLRVPGSMEVHIDGVFRRHARANVRRLLREVPKRYRLSIEEGPRGVEALHGLYRRTVVNRPRGIDRIAEHEGGFEDGWLGFYLHDGRELAAGILVQDLPRHYSVAYGAFDLDRRKRHDLEHFLILQVLDRAIRRKHRFMSLGIDTNRYGHHLSLGVAPYKLRIGFTPLAYDPGGRELMQVRSLDPFQDGLFFYAYGLRGLEAHFFPRGRGDAKAFRHPTCPPVTVHR